MFPIIYGLPIRNHYYLCPWIYTIIVQDGAPQL